MTLLIVRALEIYTPEFVKRRAIAELFHATAAAFEADVPSIGGLGSQTCLSEYARFTQRQAEQALRDGRAVAVIKQRLYWNAVAMGARYGRWLRLWSAADVMAVGRVLYRILETDFQGDAAGEVVVSRCYFSRYFSADVCRLMSAADDGLFAGLSNGGRLTFSARITEGRPCCRAQFTWER